MTISRRRLVSTAAAGAAFAGLHRPAGAQALPFGLKPGKPYAGTTVNIILPNAGQYRAQAKRLAQFQELTGIKANFVYVPYGQLLDKITTEAVSGGTAYDVITYQDTWGAALVPYMDAVDDRVKADGFDMTRYPEAYQRSGVFEGKLYGLPLRAHPQMLFYRKDLFAQAGVEPPRTLTELITVAKAVQDKTGVPGVSMNYGKGNGGQNLFLWMNYLWGNGSDIFDGAGKARFNDADGVEATRLYMAPLLEAKVANPGSVQFNEGDMVNSMAQGTAGMIMVWWWAYSTLVSGRSTLKPEQVGFVPVPGLKPGTNANTTTGMPFSLSKLSKNKDAAWEYMKWMTNPGLEVEIAADRSEPDANEIMVVHKASFANERLNAITNGLHREALRSLEGARSMPQIREWPQVAAVLESTISDIAASGRPIKAAMDEAAVQVDRARRRAGGRQG